MNEALHRRLALVAVLLSAAGCGEEPAARVGVSEQVGIEPALSERLSREGFEALRMNDEERAAILAAGEAAQWSELPLTAFPERLHGFHGLEARIEGYMIPGRIERSKVLDFLLVRDNAACCFGGMPKEDEWIQVTMEPGTHATYARYQRIVVTGVLEIGGPRQVEGLKPPALRMRAKACELVPRQRR